MPNFVQVSQINRAADGSESRIPTMIDFQMVRCFYQRKQNEPGVRITFADGGGFAVIETYDELKERAGRYEMGPHRFVELQQVVDRVEERVEPQTGEDDEEDFQTRIREVTVPTMINTAYVRCFYPRKTDERGTRITFTSGGFAVADRFSDVAAAVGAPEPASAEIIRIAPPHHDLAAEQEVLDIESTQH